MICLKAKPLVEKTQEHLIRFAQNFNVHPRLDVLLVGSNEASIIYVEHKKKAAQQLGIDVIIHSIDSFAKQKTIENLIIQLNNDTSCSAILLQLPLPTHFKSDALLTLIDPLKDVDGFHPINKGNHLDQVLTFVPCTALGVIRLLNFYQIDLKSKHVLIIGRSSIVGKPLAIECLNQDATVTIAHSATRDLPNLIDQADIIISATGAYGVVQWANIRADQIVIDIGIHRKNDKIVGDLGTKPTDKIVTAYTPVPGGVGPMTVNSLMYNIFKAYCLQKRSIEYWNKVAQSIDALTL
jgi:methylenetetrahydrofolate dehydrogenase (NADP+)/methenyltetrahydrofolate cyclohydrolase